MYDSYDGDSWNATSGDYYDASSQVYINGYYGDVYWGDDGDYLDAYFSTYYDGSSGDYFDSLNESYYNAVTDTYADWNTWDAYWDTDYCDSYYYDYNLKKETPAGKVRINMAKKGKINKGS